MACKPDKDGGYTMAVNTSKEGYFDVIIPRAFARALDIDSKNLLKLKVVGNKIIVNKID